MSRFNLAVGIVLVGTALCVSGFCLENPYIFINPVSDHEAGETFTINGTTSLSAGKILVFDIEPVRLHPAPLYEPPLNTTALTGITITENNPAGKTSWSVIVNSTSLIPDYYTIRVTSFDPPIIDGSADFNLTLPKKDQQNISTGPSPLHSGVTQVTSIHVLTVFLAVGIGVMYALQKRRNDL